MYLSQLESQNVYLSDTRIYLNIKISSVDNKCKCQILYSHHSLIIAQINNITGTDDNSFVQNLSFSLDRSKQARRAWSVLVLTMKSVSRLQFKATPLQPLFARIRLLGLGVMKA